MFNKIFMYMYLYVMLRTNKYKLNKYLKFTKRDKNRMIEIG